MYVGQLSPEDPIRGWMTCGAFFFFLLPGLTQMVGRPAGPIEAPRGSCARRLATAAILGYGGEPRRLQ